MPSKFPVFAALFFVACQNDAPSDDCRTNIGEQTFCAFSKLGSARLNACSVLFFDEKTATVALDGEAFFECENGQILKVKTPEGRLILRGSKAVVRTRPEVFEATIFEGEAVFEQPDGQLFKLEKGQTIRRDSTEKGMKKGFFQPKSLRPNWIEGFSSFENERLRNVFFELERHFDVRLKLPADVSALPFSGSFEHQNLEKALDQICRPSGLVFEQKGQKITVKKRVK